MDPFGLIYFAIEKDTILYQIDIPEYPILTTNTYYYVPVIDY